MGIPSEFRKTMRVNGRHALQAAESASVCPREDRSPLHCSVVNYFFTPLILPSLIFTTVPPHHDREDEKREHLLFPEGTIANLRTCGIYLIRRLRQTVQKWQAVPERDIIKDHRDKEGSISQSSSQNIRSDKRNQKRVQS